MPPLDIELLNGFGFTCRPDCGLCCYASPRVAEDERPRLLQIEPSVPIIELDDTGSEGIEARPEGGACHFLDANQCRVHAARPRACRRFPIHVHLGYRAQATVVLSCPGLALSALDGAGTHVAPPAGLDRELAAVAETFQREPVGSWLEASRADHERLQTRLRRANRPASPAEIRADVAENLPDPDEVDLALDDLPDETSDLGDLPLVFDPTFGRVALRSGSRGWEAIVLRESGGIRATLGRWALPKRTPRLTAAARRRWDAYIRYALGRDHLLSVAYLEVRSRPRLAVPDVVRDLLVEIGGLVIGRAWLMAAVHGLPTGELGVSEIDAGIRATDADIMDQPSMGRSL